MLDIRVNNAVKQQFSQNELSPSQKFN